LCYRKEEQGRTATHCIEGILDYMFTQTFGDPPRRHILEVTTTLCLLYMITLGDVGYPMKQKWEVLEFV